MLTDAGSIPAGSTKHGSCPDPSTPTKTSFNQRVTETAQLAGLVSVGAGGCPKRHQNDTTLTQAGRKLPVSALQLCRERILDNEYRGALTRLKIHSHTIKLKDFDLGWSHKVIAKFSQEKVDALMEICKLFQGQAESAYEQICKEVESYDLAPVQVEHGDYIGAMAQMLQPAWWNRRFCRLRREALDAIARDIGLVSQRRARYSSDQANWLFAEQTVRNQIYLEESHLVNEQGEEVSLAEVAEHTLANPQVRRAEMMCRLNGFERVADLHGDDAVFFTLTCPSRFHANLSSGIRNPRADGSTPREAQQWLCHNWALIRSALNRRGISPYGFRVAEPHHDGTPHWHLLLFVAPHQVKTLDRIVRKYSGRDDEPGAAKYRVKTVLIDRAKGSAVGYIAKYVSKNIDGQHITDDNQGMKASVSAKRIQCWASTHRIRQFQQIGGPSVTVWRELRRLRSPLLTPAIEQARCAADAGDWAAFVIAMGGTDVPRSERPIKPYYDYNTCLDTTTNEVFVDDKAWHGGNKDKPIQGLSVGSQFVRTRTHRWHKAGELTLPICGWPAGPKQMGSQGHRQVAALDSCK